MTHEFSQFAQENQTESPAVALTPGEKKILKRRIKITPGEQIVLFQGLQPVSEKAILWFKDGDVAQPIVLTVYAFKSKEMEPESNHLNREAFYVLSEFEGRVWRCKNLEAVADLQKAIKKDIKMRWPAMTWTK